MNNYHFSKLSIHNFVRKFSLNVKEHQKVNHYDCLGITPKSTQGEVKAAYYKLSKQYHPDVNLDNPLAAEKFRNISEAYEVLGNLKSRKLYDRGIFVGRQNEESYYRSENPVDDHYKHASFYHHRNKPTSKKATTLKTDNPRYNIDEWTKAHYSKTFHASREYKVGGEEFVKDKKTLRLETESSWKSIAVIILITSYMLMNGTNARDKFDIQSLKRDEKPD